MHREAPYSIIYRQMGNESDVAISVEGEISRLIDTADLGSVRKRLVIQGVVADSEAKIWACKGYPTRTALYLSLGSLDVREQTSLLALSYEIQADLLSEDAQKKKYHDQGWTKEAYFEKAAEARNCSDLLLRTLD